MISTTISADLYMEEMGKYGQTIIVNYTNSSQYNQETIFKSVGHRSQRLFRFMLLKNSQLR